MKQIAKRTQHGINDGNLNRRFWGLAALMNFSSRFFAVGQVGL